MPACRNVTQRNKCFRNSCPISCRATSVMTPLETYRWPANDFSCRPLTILEMTVSFFRTERWECEREKGTSAIICSVCVQVWQVQSGLNLQQTCTSAILIKHTQTPQCRGSTSHTQRWLLCRAQLRRDMWPVHWSRRPKEISYNEAMTNFHSLMMERKTNI